MLGTPIETPPANAASHSPSSRLRHAWCTATSEVEHDVCTLTLGPLRFSLYETREERKSPWVPSEAWKTPADFITSGLETTLAK